MLYLFLSVIAIVIGSLYGFKMHIIHKEKDYHNTNLDLLVTRMNKWETEITTVRASADKVNEQIAFVKSALSMSKRTQ